MTATCMVSYLRQWTDTAGQDIAYWQPGDEGPQATSWQDLWEQVARTASVLDRLGVGPQDRVVSLSENRFEWIVVDLAIQALQAVHVPIHATLTARQVEYQVGHSQARLACCSTPDQLAKLTTPAGLLPSLSCILLIQRDDSVQTAPRAVPRDSDRPILDWTTELARANPSVGSQRIAAACEQIRPESLATILYTSGTTGEPKGVMLSHRNLLSNARQTVDAFRLGRDALRVSFLPLSHIFARTCDLYTWLTTGSQLALARSRETVLDDCRQIRPTVLSGVPYFFEVARRAFLARGDSKARGSLRDFFGGRLPFACSGGAALPAHLYDFYLQHDLPILQGYGLTETSPVVTLSTPERFRAGSSGRPLPGVEVRLAEDRELLTRGDHVMLGYWRDPQATAEVLRDGWFATGDYGSIDADNFVTIAGRKKELIVLSSGKNVAPVQLEGLLTQDPLVHQALVFGDDRNYLVALIVPDREAVCSTAAQALSHLASAARTDLDEYARLLAHDAVREKFDQLIRDRLTDLAHHEQIRNYRLLSAPFTIEQGEVTAKLSLRRDVITHHYAAEIEELYNR